jgi:tetratricopeptide (TPR) repeat protein
MQIKQAARFAESHLWPPVKLLQARLLIEGGYYSNALDILQGIDKSALNNPADVAEYYFRFGRVYEELAVAEPGKQYYQHAFTQYRLSVTVGKSMHEQFAARSALQMGKMYEHLDLYTEAAGMYRECLDMPSHDFQNSIDQQAKAGINRVEGH